MIYLGFLSYGDDDHGRPNVRRCDRPSDLPADLLLRAYRIMYQSRKIDDKEIQLKNQSQIFFQISGAGHEAILTAAGLGLRPGYDWFFPYYRDRALCLALGVTPYEMFLQAVGAADDPASEGGRCRPTGDIAATTSCPRAARPGRSAFTPSGAPRQASSTENCPASTAAPRAFQADEVAYVSVGDGTTSEGEFWSR